MPASGFVQPKTDSSDATDELAIDDDDDAYTMLSGSDRSEGADGGKDKRRRKGGDERAGAGAGADAAGAGAGADGAGVGKTPAPSKTGSGRVRGRPKGSSGKKRRRGDGDSDYESPKRARGRKQPMSKADRIAGVMAGGVVDGAKLLANEGKVDPRLTAKEVEVMEAQKNDYAASTVSKYLAAKESHPQEIKCPDDFKSRSEKRGSKIAIFMCSVASFFDYHIDSNSLPNKSMEGIVFTHLVAGHRPIRPRIVLPPNAAKQAGRSSLSGICK